MSLSQNAITDEADRALIVPWKAHVLNPEAITKHTDGEDLCWFGMPYMRGMVSMAEALGGDRECLDAFCAAFEYMMSIASRDLDGLYGWPTTHGNYGKQGPRCIVMDDAYISAPVAHFGRLVRGHPDLEAVYGERAARYLAFIEGEVLPKWAESWLDLEGQTTTLRWIDGAFRRVQVEIREPAGVYRFFRPGRDPVMSLPMNQFLSVARAFLALHDLTGKGDYLGKVRRMAAAARSIYLVEYEDRYEPWCYWQPVWEGDFTGETETVHWVGPHPYRSSYHAVEVSEVTMLHKRGIVFTDTDVRRIVRLQLDVMWNKSLEEPKFSYVDKQTGKECPAELWRSLAYFDETIAGMAAPHQTREAVEKVAGAWNGITGVPAYLLRRKEGQRA